MTDHERIERQAFVRWMRRKHPSVSTRRYGPPARDQYLVPSVQEAWQGWFARSFRYTQSELTRAAKRGQKIAASITLDEPAAKEG